MNGFFRSMISFLVAALLFSACRIDEDLSVCESKYNLNYKVELHTNVHAEIDHQLTLPNEKLLGERLKQVFSDYFSAYAHKVDLHFYDGHGQYPLQRQESFDVNASHAWYSIFLPARDYRHLAVANAAQEPLVQYEVSSPYADGLQLSQSTADTIPSHRVALFSAREDLRVSGTENQTFHVNLYMINAAVALSIQPNKVSTQGVEMYLGDLATQFHVNDSTYAFDRPCVVRTHRLADTGSSLLCCYGMGMPSRTTASRADDKPLWRMWVNVTLPDGKVTRTEFKVSTPLKPGQLMLIKASLQPDGSLKPSNPEVGASVELDWKPGGEYEPIM